jgi:hypothetical protein
MHNEDTVSKNSVPVGSVEGIMAAAEVPLTGSGKAISWGKCRSERYHPCSCMYDGQNKIEGSRRGR